MCSVFGMVNMTPHQVSLLHMIAGGSVTVLRVPKYLSADLQTLCSQGFLKELGSTWALTAAGQRVVDNDNAQLGSALA
jgi:hypothetical protein